MSPTEAFDTAEAWTPALAGVTPESKCEDREAEVWHALDAVLDPELDEPVTTLRFVTRVDVEGDAVAVDFRLPTFWCSPNFAWIMAEDMRDALRALPWVKQTTVTLADHLFAGRINAALNGGAGFGEAFADAEGDLAALRATFRRKAFLGRMALLIDALLAEGRTEADLVALTVAELRILAGSARPQGGHETGALRRLAARYIELRRSYGGPCGDNDRAFRSDEGGDLTADGLPAFLRGVRMTRRSAEANGEMCRIYLKERAAEETKASTPPAPGSSGR